MDDVILCSQNPAQVLGLDHAFRLANYRCRITTEWGVLLAGITHTAIDAVILDAAMGDSARRCEELRAVTAAPVIVIGSSGAAEERALLMAAGAADVIAAGTTLGELVQRTGATMHRKHLMVAG